MTPLPMIRLVFAQTALLTVAWLSAICNRSFDASLNRQEPAVVALSQLTKPVFELADLANN
jgi:hypothetical protein